jgi:hypothetical protein
MPAPTSRSRRDGRPVAPGNEASARRIVGRRSGNCRRFGSAPGGSRPRSGERQRTKPVALLLADLGITKTHSRPHVSDDNPYSESQFKTLKYRPEFPDRFGSLQDARGFCQHFFGWYKRDHHHSGIALLTPEVLHYERGQEVIERRQEVLYQAYARNPERFVRACPKPQPLPIAAWINPKPTAGAHRNTVNPVLDISSGFDNDQPATEWSECRAHRRVRGASDLAIVPVQDPYAPIDL